MMSMVDLIAIGMETPKIDSDYYLKKEFTELICVNLGRVLYLIVKWVNLYHGCVCDS